jgi:hypothetical protein
MSIPSRYAGIENLEHYLVALASTPDLPSPVFRGRYPVTAEAGHQFNYRVDNKRLPLVKPSDLPVVPVSECGNVKYAPVTPTRGDRLRDRVVMHVFEEDTRAIA